MKTTIQIPNSLFEDLRTLARREQTTMKDLMQEGLRRIISERKQRSRFHLRKATFKGRGLHPEINGLSWDEIRAKSYEGRGG
ncbi:MAG: DUF2191 domain-containing protein [Deltaproteobacteria bacterium]|nr:DUF2191 domain-containing protein [Deltaproteobacteria bacterium]